MRFQEASVLAYGTIFAAATLTGLVQDKQPSYAQATVEAIADAGYHSYPELPKVNFPVRVVEAKPYVEQKTPLEPLIQKWENHYTHDVVGQRVFANRMQRIEAYDTYIEESAHKYGLDPHLLRSKIAVESGGKAGVKSGAGARGLAQVMPGTANKHCPGADLYDPKASIECGATVLRVYLGMARSRSEYGSSEEDLIAGLRGYNTGDVNSKGSASAEYAAKILAMHRLNHKAKPNRETQFLGRRYQQSFRSQNRKR